MAQAKRGAKSEATRSEGARSEATRLADLVRELVADGATTVEEIHKAIADLPLDVLERLDLFEQTVKNVRRIQDTSIGAIYDVIRKVNREATRLAAEVLERAPRRARRKLARPKPTRASARA
jgi:hypothetical protein